MVRSENNDFCIAIVIPSYKVTQHILGVINAIPKFVSYIYVVDDACPDESGKYVKQHNLDERVKIIFHERNQGVGGAVMSGYQAAIQDNVDIIVKIDGDGQMDPALIP
jgi:glycosyltransferase involved in cell wall biosynthesis